MKYINKLLKKSKQLKEDILFYHIVFSSTENLKDIFLFSPSIPVKRVVKLNNYYVTLLGKNEFEKLNNFENIIYIHSVSTRDILLSFMKNLKRNNVFIFRWDFPCRFFYKQKPITFIGPSVLLSFGINYFTKYFFEKFLLKEDVNNFIGQSKNYLKLLATKINIIRKNELIYTIGKVSIIYDGDWEYYYLLVFTNVVFNLMFKLDKKIVKICLNQL